MRMFSCLVFAFGATVSLAVSPVDAATCQAGGLTCSTTMPAGGYCECTSRGNTQAGTVVEKATSSHHGQSGATAGGCGAHPDAPGCR